MCYVAGVSGPDSAKCEPNRGLNDGAIAAMVIGLVVFTILLNTFTYVLAKKRYSSADHRRKRKPLSDTSSDVTITSTEQEESQSHSERQQLTHLKLDLSCLTPLIQGKLGVVPLHRATTPNESNLSSRNCIS